jgi:arsenite-transporting ATPase
VFDTAPTANARRLLGMSDVYSMWVNKMVQSREEAQSLKELLSYSQKKEKDPLMEYLLTFRDRMGHAKELLTDDAKTAFFFITLPEALPIAVITRFLNWFEEFGIPVGGVVVNMRIEPADVGENPPEFVRNRLEMQRDYMEEIWDRFENVRAIVPLFETQVQGVLMLARAANHLFAE